MEEGRSEKFRGKIRKGVGWSFMTKTTSSLPCFFRLSKNKMLIRFDVDLVDDREREEVGLCFGYGAVTKPLLNDR